MKLSAWKKVPFKKVSIISRHPFAAAYELYLNANLASRMGWYVNRVTTASWDREKKLTNYLAKKNDKKSAG